MRSGVEILFFLSSHPPPLHSDFYPHFLFPSLSSSPAEFYCSSSFHCLTPPKPITALFLLWCGLLLFKTFFSSHLIKLSNKKDSKQMSSLFMYKLYRHKLYRHNLYRTQIVSCNKLYRGKLYRAQIVLGHKLYRAKIANNKGPNNEIPK